MKTQFILMFEKSVVVFFSPLSVCELLTLNKLLNKAHGGFKMYINKYLCAL